MWPDKIVYLFIINFTRKKLNYVYDYFIYQKNTKFTCQLTYFYIVYIYLFNEKNFVYLYDKHLFYYKF